MRPQEEMIAALAEKMHLSAEQVVYIALNRLYIDIFDVQVNEDYPSEEAWEQYRQQYGDPEPLVRGRPGERSILDLIPDHLD